jgi:phosphoribosylcarboxyaminoimidazole (NCAIR) mutase
VIGVPIKSSISLDGWDSVLSILQMPPGVPVATMALNGARNAGIFAAQILALTDGDIMQRIIAFKPTSRRRSSRPTRICHRSNLITRWTDPPVDGLRFTALVGPENLLSAVFLLCS